MSAVVASAVLTLVGALVLGQAVLRLCGARSFNWLSAPLGLVVLMLLCVPALHLPGRTTTTGIIVVAATVMAAAWLAPARAHHPPLIGLVAGVPVFLLGLVPFLANGRVGTLGVSFNNDMASHLLWAESYRHATVSGLDNSYPLGLHSWVATVGTVLHAETDLAFAGVTLALPVLLGWTALAALRNPAAWLTPIVVVIVGMPFLVAGYYGQGSFKEIAQCIFVLGAAITLAARPPVRPVLRWTPFALIVAGSLSVYSTGGLPWPALFVGAWLAGHALIWLRGRRPGVTNLRTDLRSEAIAIGIALAGLLVVMVPQLPRIKAFLSATAGTNGTGIETSSLGNLAGPVPFWESLGIWNSADYRVLGADPVTAGAWAGLVLALVIFGLGWSWRRRDLMLPGAMLLALILWIYADRSQSPYVAAKALVILSPLLLLVALRPLVERSDGPGRSMPGWWKFAAPAMLVVVLVKVVPSSFDALRFSFVGPRAHAEELRSLRGTLGTQPTLYLGDSDFTRWELAGVPVRSPVISHLQMELRPEKPWEYGKGYDIDSVPPATLNEFTYVVAPRDASSSQPPPELRRVRTTRDFVVYRRTAAIPPYGVLPEGDQPGTVLNCKTSMGRAIARAGGVAAVRAQPRVFPVAQPIAPGGRATVRLRLPAGVWDLTAPYGGAQPVRLTGAGLDTTLPANLDRPGPRWPLGRIRVHRGRSAVLTFQPTKTWLTSPAHVTSVGSIVAVPARSDAMVPLARACGRYVDWYRPAGG